MRYEEFIKLKEYKTFMTTIKNLYRGNIVQYYMDFEDYKQEQELILWKKLQYFNNQKAKLNTFIIMVAKSTHRDLIRDCVTDKRILNNPSNLFYIDDDNNDKDFHEILTVEDIEINIDDSLFNGLDNEELKILKYKTLDYTSSEISKLIDLPLNRVNYLFWRIKKKVNRNLQKTGNIAYNI